eukprot:366258-Chlamydomonas_euryale.AAC.11
MPRTAWQPHGMPPLACMPERESWAPRRRPKCARRAPANAQPPVVDATCHLRANATSSGENGARRHISAARAAAAAKGRGQSQTEQHRAPPSEASALAIRHARMEPVPPSCRAAERRVSRHAVTPTPSCWRAVAAGRAYPQSESSPASHAAIRSAHRASVKEYCVVDSARRGGGGAAGQGGA